VVFKTTKVRILVAFLSILTFGTLLAACQGKPQVPPDSTKGTNPKLSSELNQLVQAEGRGEAASFAQQQNIDLIDNKVRVIVEVAPGQLEAATKAVSAAGIIETSYQNLLQAVVPIKSLAVLTQETSIKEIRLPMQALPDTSGGSVK